MIRDVKQKVLIAFYKGVISKVEAKQLIQSNCIITLDLSSSAKEFNPVEAILAKVPDLKNHFIRNVTLGNGKRP